jgi:hypothetical protein
VCAGADRRGLGRMGRVSEAAAAQSAEQVRAAASGYRQTHTQVGTRAPYEVHSAGGAPQSRHKRLTNAVSGKPQSEKKRQSGRKGMSRIAPTASEGPSELLPPTSVAAV